jgi:hypothetical protein
LSLEQLFLIGEDIIDVIGQNCRSMVVAGGENEGHMLTAQILPTIVFRAIYSMLSQPWLRYKARK